MKRSAILLFVLAASCMYRPTIVERHPGETLSGGTRPGTVNPRARRTAAQRAAQPCVEMGRVRCAMDACKGANMDYVTLSCSGGKEVKRCVANVECTASGS